MSAVAALADTTVQALLEQAGRVLQESDSAQLDARLLLAEVLGKSRTWLYAWPEASVDAAAVERFQCLLAARAAGTPIAYLLGRREFWSLDLEVNPAVLIPRPDTELLVETALALGPAGPAQVADLGTGSGAIALALASERPAWHLYATDQSAAALQVAERNRQRLGFVNVELLQGSWCQPLPAVDFDLIVSNPPYLAQDDAHLDQGDLRFEPRTALVAADAGLHDLGCIARQTLSRLKPGGWLLLEHGWAQGAAVRALLAEAGYRQLATHCDAAGHERVSVGARP